MSAGTRNSSTRSSGGRGVTAFQLFPEAPLLGLPIVPTAHRASSTPGDSRCLEATPPVHLARLHRSPAYQNAPDYADYERGVHARVSPAHDPGIVLVTRVPRGPVGTRPL